MPDKKTFSKSAKLRWHLYESQLLGFELVALQQLKFGAAEIAIKQMLPDQDSIRDRDDMLSVPEEHFRGRAPGRFAEGLCGGDRVHFGDLEFHPVALKNQYPTISRNEIFRVPAFRSYFNS